MREFRLHQAYEESLIAKRLVVILKETIERQLPPNPIIDAAVNNLEVEVVMIFSRLKLLVDKES